MRRRSPAEIPHRYELAEPELIDLARQGNARALGAVMQRHNRRLYRVARAVVRNDSEAEDVVQESYLHAFVHFGRFRGDSSLMTWLSRIAVNKAAGRRRRSRAALDLATIENRPVPDVQFISSLRQLDPEQIGTILAHAIDNLPEPFRDVLMARVVDDMTVEKTAQVFGLRLETVKTRLYRARERLKEAVGRRVGSELANSFPFGDHIFAS
jgi:RNA polymerase sigma-70 factor, ECF subfamily